MIRELIIFTQNKIAARILILMLRHADMAELADASDLGSGGRPCRFKSCYPHSFLSRFVLVRYVIFYCRFRKGRT